MILGVHAWVARGLDAVLGEAREHGLGVLQTLPYRRHHPPTEDEQAAFRRERAALGLKTLLIHSRYAPALASSHRTLRARSQAHLTNELRLAAGLGGDAYVVHAGPYSPGSDAETGLKLFADAVLRGAGESGFPGAILIENVPGGGRRLGGTLEDLARLLDALPARVTAGACLDTAHAWAAGYELSTAEGALRFASRAHRLLGDRVRAFHLNDSLAQVHSHRESHWHLGKGRLGLEGLRVLLEREEYADLPAILETPKEPGADAENLKVARGLSTLSR